MSESGWSLRVTIDRGCKEDLETLTSLISQKIPGGDLAAVLREAIRCAIEKHGRRKGAVAPQRQRKIDPGPRPSAQPAAPTITIPAAVRRAVWKRDGGRCAWVGPDGRRCNSRWQLELDHIQPKALGGPSTVDNLRVACKPHNMLHAEQTYGREHMERFRRERVPERTGMPAPRQVLLCSDTVSASKAAPDLSADGANRPAERVRSFSRGEHGHSGCSAVRHRGGACWCAVRPRPEARPARPGLED